MQLCLLHLDDALKNQQAFMETCRNDGAHQIEAAENGAEVRLWGRENKLKSLQQKLGHFSTAQEPQLCFMGSGDFHHITALILAATLEKQQEPVTIIHFDNHPDWVKFKNGMHCGSWVNRALQTPNVQKVITIGVCSDDLTNPGFKGASIELLSHGALELFPYARKKSRVSLKKHIHWNTIESMGESGFIEYLLPRIKTKNIYITIDKDVLSREDAETNWDQGVMRLPFLLEILRKLGENHKIIGADVNGDYSKPNYSGSAFTKLAKRAEIFLDQPRVTTCRARASAINEAANYAILEVLGEVMQ